MICPRCSVARISPLTGTCDLCGYAANAAGSVAVEHPDATDELARRELAHEFTFDAMLGHGAASTVYLAREAGGTNRHVVLKVLPRRANHADAEDRFRAAMAQVAALDHPHIIQVVRFGTSDSLFWYSSERVPARTLRDVLRSGGPLDLRTTQRIAAQIASALEHAHRRGVMHGSLKAENVLVDEAGWVRLCDPLISRALQPPRPRRITEPDGPGNQGRRPSWSAPEDFDDDQRGPAGDQYALAALLYECLTGKPPADPPVPLLALLPDLPPHVSQAIARALHPQPMTRFPSVLDFVSTLETGTQPLLDTRPSRTSNVTLAMIPDWKPPPRERRIGPMLWTGGAVLALGLAIVGWPWVSNFVRGERWEYAPVQTAPRRPAPAATPVDSAAVRPGAPVSLRPGRRPRRGETTPQARPASVAPAPGPAPAAAAPAPAPAASGETGRLFVNAAPWGQVYLDGQLIGNTPKANLTVSAGSHTIRVTREGFEPFERTIRVGAGETVRLTDITLAARP